MAFYKQGKKTENVHMVETRAALGAEEEKGDSFEYSQRGIYAPTPVFTSTPGTQSIPSVFFATHSGVEKRKKNAEKNPNAIYDTCASMAARHTHSDQDNEALLKQTQTLAYQLCAKNRLANIR